MEVGVHRIKVVAGHEALINRSNEHVLIAPEKSITIAPEQYLDGSASFESIQQVYWFLTIDPNEPPRMEFGRIFTFKIEKKMCGSFTYLLEASLSGILSDESISDSLHIQGYTPARIVRSEWRGTRDGEDIRQQPRKYGDLVFLWLDTEGLNGDRITIEICNRRALRRDHVVTSNSDIRVVDGEALYHIGDTINWMGQVSGWWEEQEFYIRVKDAAGNLILDDNGDDAHARFLRIVYEESSDKVEPSFNVTPTRVGSPPPSPQRFDPCKFEKIELSIPTVSDGFQGTEMITVFEDGQALENSRITTTEITRSINFEFNQAVVTEGSEAEFTLNNVLSFLLENTGTRINTRGYACAIGLVEVNQDLSEKRSQLVKDFFVDGGLEASRITSLGMGELNPQSPDDITKMNDPEYVNARKVDITFYFEEHGANPVIYKTIAPSTPKDAIVYVDAYSAIDCYRENDRHDDKIIIKSPDTELAEGTGGSVSFPLRSTLAPENPSPLNYIWPKYNALIRGDAAALFYVHAHSCRYYANEQAPAVIIHAYPDIKWKLTFFLNLKNDLSIGWRGQNSHVHRELQSRAGSIGAERRWRQKEIQYGVSLVANWDKKDSENYHHSLELKHQYEGKFRKLYNLFGSISEATDGIIRNTKGRIFGPATFRMKPPNVNIEGSWNLEKVESEIGTKVQLAVQANPLLELEVTIDLLCLAVSAAGGLVAGPAAAAGAASWFNSIMSRVNSGVNIGNQNLGARASADVYFDLILKGSISLNWQLEFNTEGGRERIKSQLEAGTTVGVEIKAGARVNGEANLVIVRVDAYFAANVGGRASITFKHVIEYDERGLYYKPELGFDGLIGSYSVEGRVGLSWKQRWLGGGKTNATRGTTLARGELELVPKFDVIKSLGELLGIEIEIPLIRNEPQSP